MRSYPARVGVMVRSLSSFLRCGNKHTTLVMHMKHVQRPELAPESCGPRLRAIYGDAHELVKRYGQFHKDLDGTTTSLDAPPRTFTTPDWV